MDRRKDYLVEEGKRIWAISATGLSRRQLKISVAGASVVFAQQAAQAGAQSPGAGRIVGHVENPFDAVPMDALEAAGPMGFANARGN